MRYYLQCTGSENTKIYHIKVIAKRSLGAFPDTSIASVITITFWFLQFSAWLREPLSSFSSVKSRYKTRAPTKGDLFTPGEAFLEHVFAAMFKSCVKPGIEKWQCKSVCFSFFGITNYNDNNNIKPLVVKSPLDSSSIGDVAILPQDLTSRILRSTQKFLQ